jgi:acyl dehydratase
MSISDSTVGQSLVPLVKPPIEQEQLHLYAAASGDYNPIHLDNAAARRVGLDGVIAHGMLSMAFLGQFVNQQIAADPGARVDRLKVRYIAMVRPGDTLTCLGKVTARTESETETAITLACWAQNQRGEKVTTGEAVVHVPLSESVPVS